MKPLFNMVRRFGQVISNVASALRHPLKFYAAVRAASALVDKTMCGGSSSPIEFARSMTPTQRARAKRIARALATGAHK